MANIDTEGKNMAAQGVELDDSQLDDIAGGAYDERTGTCTCNGCGTRMDLLGVDKRGVKTFKCPKCGRGAHVYY
jgi:tRNA(Ile2) C34 agmatinyltransferase TiaS